MSSSLIEVYIPKYFFLHAASLHQSSLHCAIFPTAASRRSLGRVSVPMWPSILSDRLLIVALVGLYLTNRLISRGLILYHYRFSHRKMPPCELMRFYHKFLYAIPRYKADYPRVTHPSATRISGSDRSLHQISSFDLHVLSVPPAFILSQDQTLILKFVRTSDSLSRFLHPCITVFRIDLAINYLVIFLPSLPTETISGSQY